MNKKAQIGAGSEFFDYILFALIFIFGVMFVFAYLSLSLTLRDDATLEAVGSLQDIENLVNQGKIKYVDGNEVDVDKLKSDVDYIAIYGQLPQQEVVGLQEI
jgi:hypothetical protein